MTFDEFQLVSLGDLERKTRIAKSSWSQYFNRRRFFTEKTLNKAAVLLDMEPSILLLAIEARRKKVCSAS
jgi:transcriptional regulator with XRE-family HTH domain